MTIRRPSTTTPTDWLGAVTPWTATRVTRPVRVLQ
jgi:hypothetical protein